MQIIKYIFLSKILYQIAAAKKLLGLISYRPVNSSAAAAANQDPRTRS